MPTYEMPLLLRIMKKPELIETLKRTTGTIFKTGGFIRKIENWGVKELPCKIHANEQSHREANHFMICFDIPPLSLEKIKDEYKRDVDIIRIKVYKQTEPVKNECTFHDELLPAVHRPSVQKLIAIAKKQQKPRFEPNSGLDYYPFAR